MSELDARLRREARVFSRSLVGREPGDYVVDRYVAFHHVRELPAAPRFDRALVAIARTHPLLTRLCDAYAARLRRTTLLRRKLVLALAILECAPRTHLLVEEPGRGGAALGLPRLVVRGALEGVALLIGALFLVPLHVVLAAAPGPRSADS